MTIEIRNKKYNFELTGTVGLIYAAEILLGEPFDKDNRKHMLYLYYTAIQASNPGKELPDVLTFITSLTSEMLTTMSEYFWAEWDRIEGPSQPPAAEGEDKNP